MEISRTLKSTVSGGFNLNQNSVTIQLSQFHDILRQQIHFGSQSQKVVDSTISEKNWMAEFQSSNLTTIKIFSTQKLAVDRLK